MSDSLQENEWRLYDAKNRLSEVLNLALTKGPQWIRRNRDEVVIISREEFERLSGQKKTFLEFLSDAPLLDDLDLERDRSEGREINF